MVADYEVLSLGRVAIVFRKLLELYLLLTEFEDCTVSYKSQGKKNKDP